MTPAEVVRALWARIQDRDWVGVRDLIADDLVLEWPATGETFVGADNFIAVQSEYPEGWTIQVLRVIASGDEVVAEVEVPQDGVGVFRTASFAHVRDGRVAHAVEYWVALNSEAAPAWRAPYRVTA